MALPSPSESCLDFVHSIRTAYHGTVHNKTTPQEAHAHGAPADGLRLEFDSGRCELHVIERNVK